MQDEKKQILILLVENKPGVLMKISSLCRRRRFNIDSLTVGASHLPNISQITLVFQEDKSKLKNISNHLNKLIEVISVQAMEKENMVDRELVLVIVKNAKIAAKIFKKNANNLSVRMVNNKKGKFVLEMVGSGAEIETVLNSLDIKKEVIKLVRSGLVAIKL